MRKLEWSVCLSIVVPVFNAGNTIGGVIEKVLGQDFADFELILVDDGSRDRSLEVMREWARRDGRVRVFHQENGGASSARNLGLSKMRGEFVEFVDADDDFSPEIFGKMVAQMRKEGADMVTCQMKYNIVRDGEVAASTVVYGSALPRRRKEENFRAYVVKLLGINGRLYHPANKIYRADIVRKYRVRFVEGLDFGEDLTFNLHYLAHAGSVGFLNEVLYYYNFDAAHGTFGKSALVYENRAVNFAEVEKFCGTPEAEPFVSWLRWIKHYWFYSYALAVHDFGVGFSRKLELLRGAIRTERLMGSRREVVGGKKVWLERLIRFVGRTAVGLYFFVAVSSFIKGNRVLAGVWRRQADRAMK